MSRPAPASFHFSAGCLCLDFANTRSWRPSAAPHERLLGHDDLLRWGQRAGLLTGRQAATFRAAAARRPAAARATQREALALRETIYRAFSAIADGAHFDGKDAAHLFTRLAGILRGRQIRAQAGRLAAAPIHRGGAEGLEGLVLWPVIWSATTLLAAPELAVVRKCAASNCGWLFIDTTRNRSRRWCDMRVCGNRAKVRAYQRRTSS